MDIPSKLDLDYYQVIYKVHDQGMDMVYNHQEYLLMDDHNIHVYIIHNYYQLYYVHKYTVLKEIERYKYSDVGFNLYTIFYFKFTLKKYQFQLHKYLHDYYNYKVHKGQKDHHLVDRDEIQVHKIHKIVLHSHEDIGNVLPNQRFHLQHHAVLSPI